MPTRPRRRQRESRVALALVRSRCATAPRGPGATGPANWGALSPAYAACADGSKQSPIDIAKTSARGLRNIAFHYRKSSDVKVVNNGHTVEWEFPEGSASITIGSATYPLIQMHFHTPSEHRVGGRSFPLELHIVHNATATAAAVVGFLVQRGARNATWAPLVAALPASARAGRSSASTCARCMPADRAQAFRYAGSLTTPPCQRGHPLEPHAHADRDERWPDRDEFRAIYNGNRRPLQPLSGRKVTADSSRGS